MKKSLLYEIYLAQSRKNWNLPSEPFDYLKQIVTEEEYLNAEELFTDAIAKVQEQAFYAGCDFLPKLIKDLMND